jgi:Tetratricopeptide repeat
MNSPREPATLPLRLRLRNAPPLLVGRDDEERQLAAAMARGALSVLWGIGGIGKTALALHMMHRCFAARVDTAISIAVLPTNAPGELFLQVARALQHATAGDGPAWDLVAGDDERLLTLCVDLAAAGPHLVLVEDAHHAPPQDVRRLLLAIHHYGREGSWLVTTRRDPGLPELLGQVVTLGALSEEHAQALCRHWAPQLTAERHRKALRAAGGSPWRLQQLLAGRVVDGRDDLLAGLSETERATLELLSSVETALPTDIPALDGETLRGLAQRGLVELGDGTARLHDVARSWLHGSCPSDHLATLARDLAGRDEHDLVVEGLRLWFDYGDVAQAVALLDARIDWLLSGGMASRLWPILSGIEADDLLLPKLVVACELGAGHALDWACAQPRPWRTPARLLWARAHLYADRTVQVRDETAVLLAELERRDPTFAEAALLHARACLALGELEAALGVLDDIAGSDVDVTSRVSALCALLLARLKRPEPSVAAVRELVPTLGRLEWATRARVIEDCAFALADLGRVDEMATLLASAGALSARELSSPRLRGMLIGHAQQTLVAGKLDEADALLQQASPNTPAAPMHDLHGRIVALRLGLARGELASVPDDITRAFELARPGDPLLGWLAVIESYARHIVGVELPRRSEPERRDALSGVFVSALEHLGAWRRGQTPEPLDVEAKLKDLGEVRDAELALRAVSAMAHTFQAEPRRAADELGAIAARAQQWGAVIHRVDALILRCDALQIVGDVEALATTAAELRTLGRALPSDRVVAIGRFHATTAGDTDPAVLAELANLVAVAPIAARRARALLGGAASSDRLDTLVLEALRARLAIEVVALRAPIHQGGTWGLDARSRRLWFPSGDRIDLSASDVSWGLLLSLAELGEASKQALAERVWGVKRYNPLRDDKRIQVAVRRLRKLLERDPSRPKRLVTTEDGYCFGGDEGLIMWRALPGCNPP